MDILTYERMFGNLFVTTFLTNDFSAYIYCRDNLIWDQCSQSSTHLKENRKKTKFMAMI